MLRCARPGAQVFQVGTWALSVWLKQRQVKSLCLFLVCLSFVCLFRSQPKGLPVYPSHVLSCTQNKKRTELTKVFFLPNFLPCMYLSDFRFCQQLSRSCSDFNVEELRLLCIVLPVHRDFVNYLSLLTEILKYTWGVYYFILFYKRLTNYFPDLNTRLINILFII